MTTTHNITATPTATGWTYHQGGSVRRKSKKAAAYTHAVCWDGEAVTFHRTLKGALTQQRLHDHSTALCRGLVAKHVDAAHYAAWAIAHYKMGIDEIAMGTGYLHRYFADTQKVAVRVVTTEPITVCVPAH